MKEAYIANTFMAFWYSIIIFLPVIFIIKAMRIKRFERLWTKAAVFAFVFVVMMTINMTHLLKRFSKAEHLITCCEQYKHKYGEYPKELVDIVPEFYNTVPPPRSTHLSMDGYYYFSHEDRHILGFDSAGFHTDYNLDTKTWRSWD